jgi:DNA-binding MarR family transcriptional regulator
MRIDVETRAGPDDHQSLRLWLRLLACTKLIETQVRQGLKAGYSTTLPRFDLMAQLDRADAGLKMGELSRRMMVTGGNVTGITDMLEKEHLVVREPDPADRRAYRVRLTREGRRQFRRMAAEHERWVIGLMEGLSRRQRDQLVELLGVLKAELSRGIAATEESDGKGRLHELPRIWRRGISAGVSTVE